MANESESAQGNEWNGWNDPMKMDADFEVNFNKMPLEGNLGDQGLAWPGNYWPNEKGGIAHRWRATNPQDFKYRSPNFSQVLTLSKEEINQLSPAEKYDLYMGSYDYPTVRSVWGQTSEHDKDWYGICHGVAPSSLHHPEPQNNTVYNKDGIEITFFTSDVKALLAYYYAKIGDSDMVQVGKRCFVASWVPIFSRSGGCADVNPASLHIIMANKLGIQKTGFIADIDRFSQVWNHAAVKYTSQVIRKGWADRKSTSGTVEKLLVVTSVSYAASIDPTEGAVINTDKAKYEVKEYKYWLELDYKGDIIGGKWESKDRPDFLWFKEKDEFKDYWAGINDIYVSNQ